MAFLDFEKPILELESKIEELKHFGKDKNITLGPEVKKLEEKLEQMKKEIYSNLTAWQRVLIARHPDRPYTYDYIRMMMTNFIELQGDRLFAEDLAIVAGFAKLNGHQVIVIGHQKGRDTKENVKRNFGCAHPEGYRKAIRIMEMADKFYLPVVIFIDTPGAYPGVGAEERGQAQAIAENLKKMQRIRVPIVAVVIGEGGSGGALGIGIADRVNMLEHSYYSVISPEGCASILWRNSIKAPEAASALKMMGENLLEFGLIDKIIQEPLGGAHHDPVFVTNQMKKILLEQIKELSSLSAEELLDQRYKKYRKMGAFVEQSS